MSSSPGRSPTAGSRAHRRTLARLLPYAVAAIGAAYLLEPFTPLRVEEDSTEYLVLAARLADGGGVPLQSDFPPGLPVLLGGLDAAGLARSAVFVLVNIGFLALGLAAAVWVLRRELRYSPTAVLGVTALTLLSFNAVRHTAHPLTDIPFFGVSLLTLAVATAAYRRRSAALVAAAACPALLACSLRTIGVALVPALVVALPARYRRAAVPAVLVLGGLALVVLGPQRYLGDVADHWSGDPVGQALGHSWGLLRMTAEDGLNVPASRLPGSTLDVLPVVGAFLLVPIVAGALRLRRRAPVTFAYLAGTAFVLLVWPFSAPRFLLPVTPLLAACVLEAIRPLTDRAAVWGSRAWVAVYAAAGVLALATTTAITFSGDRFPERYGKNFRATYRVAWGQGSEADRRAANPRMLWVLRRYEPRAVGTAGPKPPP